MKDELYVHIAILTKYFLVCSSWRREPKQDHLVCFLAGSLLLGAVSTRDGGTYEWASVPPTEEELNVGDRRAARDWKTGLELLNTCMETHKTETYARPSHLLPLQLLVLMVRVS